MKTINYGAVQESSVWIESSGKALRGRRDLTGPQRWVGFVEGKKKGQCGAKAGVAKVVYARVRYGISQHKGKQPNCGAMELKKRMTHPMIIFGPGVTSQAGIPCPLQKKRESKVTEKL